MAVSFQSLKSSIILLEKDTLSSKRKVVQRQGNWRRELGSCCGQIVVFGAKRVNPSADTDRREDLSLNKKNNLLQGQQECDVSWGRATQQDQRRYREKRVDVQDRASRAEEQG